MQLCCNVDQSERKDITVCPVKICGVIEVKSHSHLLLHCMELKDQLDSPVALTSRASTRLPIEQVSSEMEILSVWENTTFCCQESIISRKFILL
jgi:hypothetical protein